ncbi:MAG: F0F1 ATP synthase subunit gamma [Syntrophotaleaceae bacterium]
MATLQELQRKIKSAEDLHGVVRTMKTLAAVNIRQYERAVASLDEYYRTVELGLRAVLLTQPTLRRQEAPAETLAMIFGSDQGMAGRFSETIVDFADCSLETKEFSPGRVSFWVAGSRTEAAAEASFGPIERLCPLPSSANLITTSVQEIVLQLEERRRERGDVRFVLFYNTPTSGLAYDQRSMPLLPPDRTWLEEIGTRRWPGRSLPLYTLPREQLFAALIREYLFVSLFRAFAASLAAENAARLAAMQRAEKNISERKEELHARYHSVRQSFITEELLDVISGFEALRKE